MEGSNEMRIVLLGKTGAGKSSLGNTILGESLLKTKNGPKSVTEKCQAESKVINGVRTKVIDGPGFFDTKMDENELKAKILQSVKHWLPGPHAFLIVLKVDRYTEQEREVINKTLEYFSEEALKHAVVVFTHGDQLSEGQTIKDFVGQDEALKELVEKCGGRCHVVDNKYWNNDQSDDYRNNKFQVAQLLNTIETMKKRREFYSNELLKKVEEDKSGNILKILAGVGVGVLLGGVFGLTLGTGLVALLGYKTACLTVGGLGGAATGGVVGGAVGHFSETPLEAVKATAKAMSCIHVEAMKIITTQKKIE